MTTNHKCDHFKMSYWVILERTSHKPAIGCPFFSNVEQVVQADSMSPSPPQTVVNLSTVERLFCQSSADANWQYVAVLSGEAKQNGVEELLCIHCSTEPLSLTHTGHSRWGDTCHSCTVRSEGRSRQAATCLNFTKDARHAVESVIFCNTALKIWNAKLLVSLKHRCHLDFAIKFLLFLLKHLIKKKI